MIVPVVECTDDVPTPHVCVSYGDVLLHSGLKHPFANGETEVVVTSQFREYPRVGTEVEVTELGGSFYMTSELIEQLREPVDHYECDDCWYSCPLSKGGCCDHGQPKSCTCDAGRVNAERSAAADLIESQQARIEELERIVRTYAVMTRTQGLGLSESDAALLASLAASPDTPETRP